MHCLVLKHCHGYQLEGSSSQFYVQQIFFKKHLAPKYSCT